MAIGELIVESVTLIVSVLVASGLAYLFGTRSARKERLYDSRVSRYERLIQELDTMRAAVVTFRLLQDFRPATVRSPKQAVMMLSGFAGRALGTNRLAEGIKEFEKRYKGQKDPSGVKAQKKRLADFQQHLLTEVALVIGQRAETVTDLSWSLRITGSKAIDSEAYRGLQKALDVIAQGGIAQMLVETVEKEPPPFDQATKDALEKLGTGVEQVLLEIQKEIKRTL